MRVSRRSFLGGAVGSLALMFGGFGWKEPQDWYIERETGLTIEKLLEAKRVLDEQGGPENGKYWAAIHPSNVEEAKRLFGDQVRVIPTRKLDDPPMTSTEVLESFLRGEMSWNEFHEERGFTFGVDREKYKALRGVDPWAWEDIERDREILEAGVGDIQRGLG